ncbi:MAG: cysteine--tRNA ligase, partial [Smithellaceae bacterium]|nr:cysteine--tRNA ligase [Smithellaceae bacterium]
HVALQKAKELDEGIIVVILPDGGERYLSTELFADQTQSTLKIYNILTKEKEFFKATGPGEVKMFSCGPTVHEIPHLGHYRRFVVADMIRRYLEFKGNKVKHVTDLIDLADRSIKGAEASDMEIGSYTKRYIDAFLDDAERLNIKSDGGYPRASENVDAMIKLTEKLVEKGFAYEKLRSVYFDISKLPDYGLLSNVDLGRVKQGKTIELDDYEKDSPVDFALLKRSNLSELKRGVFFKTKWGNVRPSWHMECAALSLSHLAETLDIHVGGADTIFPHCDNVMAIGKAATGKPLANNWVNVELVMVEGKKMSRSAANTITIAELGERGYHGRDIRFLLLGPHYRKPLNFSSGALEAARNTVRRLDGFIQRLHRFHPGEGGGDVDQCLYDLTQGFAAAMDDDFNVSGAMAQLFAFIGKISRSLVQGTLSTKQRDNILAQLTKINGVLAIMKLEEEIIPEEAKLLLREREALRAAKKWDASDQIREKLAEMGIEVSDSPEGMIWRLK